MIEIGHEDVKKILRQRFPILLVDQVIELELHSHLTAIKNVTYNDSCFTFLKDDVHLQDSSYPCSLIIESFCQAAGMLYVLSYDKVDTQSGEFIVFGSISNFRFYEPVFPGDTMVHRTRLDRGFDNAAIFGGEVWVNDKRIASVSRVVVAFREAVKSVMTAGQLKLPLKETI
jgi:3-hydroxyacyl-[acyl-carrier-protein] dehydratase